jgi:hypothetical protein
MYVSIVRGFSDLLGCRCSHKEARTLQGWGFCYLGTQFAMLLLPPQGRSARKSTHEPSIRRSASRHSHKSAIGVRNSNRERVKPGCVTAGMWSELGLDGGLEPGDGWRHRLPSGCARSSQTRPLKELRGAKWFRCAGANHSRLNRRVDAKSETKKLRLLRMYSILLQGNSK